MSIINYKNDRDTENTEDNTLANIIVYNKLQISDSFRHNKEDK